MPADSEQFRKAMAGKLNSMLRSNALLGQIANAVPDAADCGPAGGARWPTLIAAWNGLLLRQRLVARPAPSRLRCPCRI
ncbi:MAG TPA: hypothetical protein VGP22_09885 [Albitalea sp.]|nr:hypothetical protein [Albitalea sp.]